MPTRALYSDDTMCSRISIDYRNDYCSDDISVLICRWYLFVLLTTRRRCVIGKDIFCRLLIFTGRSRRGVAFYLMLHLSRVSAPFTGNGKCVLNQSLSTMYFNRGHVWVLGWRKSVTSTGTEKRLPIRATMKDV